MSQLYRYRWESSEGQILDENGDYTSGFLLWYRKTEGLTDQEWQHGLLTLENELREAERMGEAKDIWPPSYAAFFEKCKSYGRTQSTRYKRTIESEAEKEKRFELGRRECKKLLKMIDEDS